MNFELTDEAVEEAIKAMGTNGDLQLRLTRRSETTLEVGLYRGDIKMLELKPVVLKHNGDELALHGLKFSIDIQRADWR